MDVIIEIIFGRIIIRIFGVYTRYIFFAAIGKKKDVTSLRGKEKDIHEGVSQDFWNALIGLIIFGAVSFLIVYLTFM